MATDDVVDSRHMEVRVEERCSEPKLAGAQSERAWIEVRTPKNGTALEQVKSQD